jgi:hypothetical protein
MIITNIKNFLEKNKKVFYYIFLFFIVSFLSSDITFAASWDTMAQGIAKWANEFLSVVSLFTWLLTYLATMFLSPEWINGSLFWMNGKFKVIWIMVSNIVYFVFAFIIIWIAFMNIIWKNADQYQLKQALPRFIVWVLIVPFSWFLVQFILSISAILTVSALTLPYDSFKEYETAAWKLMIPSECKVDLSSQKEWEYINCDKAEKIPLSKVLNSWDSSSAIYWVLSMYTFWVTWLSNVDSVKFDEIDQLKQLWDIAMKLVFDVLFIFIYFILLVALWLVLMIRWIYIWIYIMLSPIFWLMYFFDKKDWGGDWFFAKFNLKEFIALAMVPVYTMLALSFWMLFIYVVWTWMWLKSTNNINSFNITSTKTESTITIWKEVGSQIKFTVSGALWTTSDKLTNLIWDGKNVVLWYIWMLILKLFGIVVLWWTVMAAMRTSEITKTIVEPLHQFGTKVWWIVSSAPWNIPIFGGQSMKSMDNVASQISWWISSNQSNKASEFMKKNPFLPWSNWASSIADLTKIKNTMNWKKSDPMFQIKSVEEWLIKAWSAVNARSLEASRWLILDALKNLGLNTDGKITINSLKDEKSFNEAMNLIDKRANEYDMPFMPDKTWSGIVDTDVNSFIKKWIVSDYSPTWWNSNSQITSQNSSEDWRILNITLNNQKVHFDNKWNIRESSFDEFARSIDRLSYEKAKELYSSQWVDNFDELFKKAQGELWNDALSKDDKWNIQIDLSKKK